MTNAMIRRFIRDWEQSPPTPLFVTLGVIWTGIITLTLTGWIIWY